MESPKTALEPSFERIRLVDLPDALSLALANTEPRIAEYALEPPAAVRRGRLKAVLSTAPWIGDLLAQPERSYWIVSKGEHHGVLLLDLTGRWLHLHFVALTRVLQGTGAAARTLAFVEEQARVEGVKGIDLYVDRRNYRAYHLYMRNGYRLAPERRYIFEVSRDIAPTVGALAAIPWHLLAEVFGAVGARGLAGRPLRSNGDATSPVPFVLRTKGIATITVDHGEPIERTLRELFQRTLARTVRVSVPFAANIPGGRLIAVLLRMEKVLA